MAKYFTVKKQKNKSLITKKQVAQIDATINSTVAYIEKWTKKEFLSMVTQTSLTPICVLVSDSEYLISKFKIKLINGTWVACHLFNSNRYIFSSRSIAVIYVICEHRGYYKLAEEILRHNTSMLNIIEDLKIYSYRKNAAAQKNDSWQFAHYAIMEDSAKYKLEDTKKLLEKSLNLAKYFKIQWESNNEH